VTRIKLHRQRVHYMQLIFKSISKNYDAARSLEFVLFWLNNFFQSVSTIVVSVIENRAKNRSTTDKYEKKDT
jgi:hypothetical protein